MEPHRTGTYIEALNAQNWRARLNKVQPFFLVYNCHPQKAVEYQQEALEHSTQTATARPEEHLMGETDQSKNGVLPEGLWQYSSGTGKAEGIL